MHDQARRTRAVPHEQSSKVMNMSEMDYQVMELANGKPVKMWTQGVAVEDEARAQLRNTAQMPFIFSHVAVMPDVHLGSRRSAA